MPTPNADPANENKIKADPSKAFFIEMLIRDISLDECILDLTDNSVHNLIRESNLDVMQTLLGKSPAAKRLDANIAIATSAKEFRIEDTCGGITIDDAREDVFRFGKSKRETAHTGLGVYGIGMKRAFFKLGRNITVESRTDTEEFRVDIDVDEWESRPDDWSLSFAYARKRDKNGRQPGTTITVRDLNTSVKTYFDNISFQNELTRRLASTYALFLKAGLTLSINGNIVKPRLPELLTSGDLKPVRNLFRAGAVDVLILAGITPKEDKEPRGWYVFCNGRMVLEADKTDLTGWGENKFPQFHSKFNHFLGLVYFRSKNLQALPWTTTKDGVEKESTVYQAALGQMRVLTKPITDFLSKLYPAEDTPMQDRPEFALWDGAHAVSLDSLAKTKNTSFVAKTKAAAVDQTATICYKRSIKDVNRARVAFKRAHMSYKEVGEETFEYFMRKECD